MLSFMLTHAALFSIYSSTINNNTVCDMSGFLLVIYLICFSQTLKKRILKGYIKLETNYFNWVGEMRFGVHVLINSKTVKPEVKTKTLGR